MTEVGQRVAALETKMDTLHGRIYGNGQPGDIEKHERRIATLEKLVYKVTGGFAGLVVLIEVLHELPIGKFIGSLVR